MTYILSVVYPAGANFNMDYYLSTHMPLVQKTWGPFGLKSYKIVQYNSSESPYSVQAWLEWESKEANEKGFASPDSAPVFADIDKFTDKKPVLASGELKDSATL